MPKSKCPGCKISFPMGRSYTLHMKKCKAFRREIAESVNAYKEGKQARILESRNHRMMEENEVENDTGMEEGPSQTIPSSPPPPALRPSGRPNRQIRLPARFRDDLPAPPPPVVQEEQRDEVDGDMEIDEERTETTQESQAFTTNANRFGVFRKYTFGAPTVSPIVDASLASVSDSVGIAGEPSQGSPWNPLGMTDPQTLPTEEEQIPEEEPNYHPFTNASMFYLILWFYNASRIKSFKDLNVLVNEVFPKLKLSDFPSNFSAAREVERMDKALAAKAELPFNASDGWIEGSVSIPLACDGVRHTSESEAPAFTVDGIFYRRPLEVIKNAFSEPAAERFHMFPFREYWKPSKDSERVERIISEVYTADILNDEYEAIKKEKRTGPNSELEPVVAGVIFYSDSTHLTNFGNASLWPIYMYIGNQSKYERGKPSEFAAHHIAYIPKLDGKIAEFYKATFGKAPTTAMLTHLKRDVVQAIWKLLLDDDILNAYKAGHPLKLHDAVMRALFLRFVFYSMDYPEKVLISCIKFLGKCICPRCLSEKSKVTNVGSKSDMKFREKTARKDSEARQYDIESARKAMYVKGLNVSSKKVEGLLAETSAVPSRNAFSERFFSSGFNFYQLFAPDFLHEIELGVWKAVFTHLLRILVARGNDSIQSLNARYRRVASFGRDTIRKFSSTVSAMHKLAARDFEDLLQCALPCFEGLLPPRDDRIVQDLLFEMATWHALAKLRLHTESTLSDLEGSSTRLCALLRKFKKDVCSRYQTKDLSGEVHARGRREAKKAQKAAEEGRPTSAPAPNPSKIREFNMNTYKMHAIPDYAASIRKYGTTDNTSSQMGECEHKRAKSFYSIIRKGDHARGIAKHVYRERKLHQASQESMKREEERKGKIDRNSQKDLDSEEIGPVPADKHHQISVGNRRKIEMLNWLANKEGDPALKDFVPRLKNHLLGRLQNNQDPNVEYSPQDRSRVSIIKDRLYSHRVLRVNYTTYDVRRDQDSINPRTHADIMVLAPKGPDEEDSHPYWYARVVGIYHADISYKDPESQAWSEAKRMEFIFVRWFGLATEATGGWKSRRLHQIGFLEEGDPCAFGFVDPADIIRAAHIIPRFVDGVTDSLLGPSFARSLLDNDQDYVRYYVNFFVDRDMVMRFRGGGVGHTATRDATDYFYQDRDKMDEESFLSRVAEEEMDDDDDISVSEGEDGGEISERELDELEDRDEEDEEAPEDGEEAESGEAVDGEAVDGERESDEEPDDELVDDVDELGFAAF